MYNLFNVWWELTKKILCNNHGGFDFMQLFTPPKSKDPWTAATKGSTGGWAKPYAKPFALLPAIGAILGSAIAGPGVGSTIAAGIGAIQGKTTGIWGKPSWGSSGIGALHGLAQSSVGNTIGGMGSTGGLQSAANAIQAIGSAGAGAPGTYGAWGSAGGGVPGDYLAGQAGAYGMPNYATGISGAGSSLANAGLTAGGSTGLASSPGSFGAWGTSQIPNYAQNFANATGGALSSAFNPYAVAGATAKGINWGQVAGGLGTALAPSLMGGETPQIPQSELYGQMTSRLLGDEALSSLGQLGRDKLTGGLNEEFSPVPDEYYNASVRRLDEAYDKAEKDFTTQYQGMRPGANVESDSAYRQGLNEIRTNRAREKSALAAELDYRREADYYDRQYQNIVQALGVDNQTMQNYMALAQMDANNLALNTGISLGEAQQFKEIFGNLGGYLMQRGLGLNDPSSALRNLMGQFA